MSQAAEQPEVSQEVEELNKALELLTKQSKEQPQGNPNEKNEMFSKMFNSLKRAMHVIDKLYKQSEVVLQKRKRL